MREWLRESIDAPAPCERTGSYAMTDRLPSDDGQGAFRQWAVAAGMAMGRFTARLRSYYERPLVKVVIGLPVMALAYYVMTLPSNPEGAANIRGGYFQSQGQLDQAIAEYDIAIKAAPNWYNPYIGRGSTYRMQGKLDAALADLTKSIELNPNHAEAYSERGQAWRDKGDSARALRDFTEAIRIDPAKAPPYFERAVILRDQRAFASAVTDLDHALDRQQKATWYITRARIKFLELDLLPQAADDFAAAAREAIKYRNWRRLMDGANHEKDWMDFERPFDPDGYYLLLWAHYARARAGQDDGPEMAELLKVLASPYHKTLLINDPVGNAAAELERQALAPWPGPLYGLMLGKITSSSAALAAADTAADDVTRKRRQCDADFYLALFRRQAAEVDEAQRLLQAAAELCPDETLESSFAKNELKRQRG
jgi:tetratricopeptide (TPR) repeat protein